MDIPSFSFAIMYKFSQAVIQRSFSDEGSRKHNVGIPKIFRFALNDNIISSYLQ